MSRSGINIGANPASKVEVGVSLIWINKTDPSLPFRTSKINFDVCREPLGLRISDFKILGDRDGSATRRFFDGIKEDANSTVLLDNERAIAEYKQGLDETDDNAAIRHFNTAIAIKPNFVLAYDTRGSTKLRLGDRTGSEEDFNQALRLDPSDALAIYQCALFQPIRSLADDANQTATIDPRTGAVFERYMQ
jgi:tetratricopeptide (TPR) repeat protein